MMRQSKIGKLKRECKERKWSTSLEHRKNEGKSNIKPAHRAASSKHIDQHQASTRTKESLQQCRNHTQKKWLSVCSSALSSTYSNFCEVFQQTGMEGFNEITLTWSCEKWETDRWNATTSRPSDKCQYQQTPKSSYKQTRKRVSVQADTQEKANSSRHTRKDHPYQHTHKGLPYQQTNSRVPIPADTCKTTHTSKTHQEHSISADT